MSSDKNQFSDGLVNISNQLTNRRNATSQNRFMSHALGHDQMREIYRSGIGSKIVRIKSGFALKNTLEFANDADKTFYQNVLARPVKQAASFMIGFGRGVILIHKRGDDLTRPMGVIDNVRDYKLSVFSGDLVSAQGVSIDLDDARYMRPEYYQIRGRSIHHTRIVDFTYVKPSEMDLGSYNYGGVSEFEMIYGQLVNDGIVERAAASILERSSNWVYKIEGFKAAMESKRDEHIIKYFSTLEDMRSLHGATLLDSADAVESLSQSLSNLADVDQITLRRLAMVTGIPLPILVGENVKGLNSSGDNERQTFVDMIETLQEEYLLDPIALLCDKFGIAAPTFATDQGETAATKTARDKTIVDIAKVLYDMGRDPAQYLRDNGIENQTAFEMLFPEQTGDL